MTALRHDPFKSPELPMPGIAATRPPLYHGEAGHGETPFITLPPLRGARLSLGGLSDNVPHAGDPAQGTEPAAGRDPGPAAAPSQAPLPGTGPSGSIALVQQRRLEQIARGYTPEHDLKLPIGFLANEAGNYQVDARDWLLRRRNDPLHRHYEGKLIHAAALLVAELDRLHAWRAAQ